MVKILTWVLFALAVLAVLALLGGRLGWFSGSRPADLGVRDGQLRPAATSPNSVSSSAKEGDAAIRPLMLRGDPATAMRRLADLVAKEEGARVVTVLAGYLHAECATRWMGFVDDLEFYLPEGASEIQVRSGARLGYRDFGVNRARVERLRAKWDAQ